MANVAGRHGRGRLVGVCRRVRFSQKVNFRGVETEFWSDWTPFEWLPSGRFQKIEIGWAVDGRGYLKMPRRLGEKYFHRQLLEDSGLARAGHEMVTHDVNDDRCNNSLENLLFMSRRDHALKHFFGGAH